MYRPDNRLVYIPDFRLIYRPDYRLFYRTEYSAMTFWFVYLLYTNIKPTTLVTIS